MGVIGLISCLRGSAIMTTANQPQTGVLPITKQSDAAAVAAALAHHVDRLPSEFRDGGEKLRQAAVDAANRPKAHGLEDDLGENVPAVIAE